MGNENKTDDHKEEQLRKLVECMGSSLGDFQGVVCEKDYPESEESHTTDQSLLNLFYQIYSENQHIETEKFRSQLEPLDDRLVEIVNGVERSKVTEVENLVADFCTAYEKHAFIEGMKAGVHQDQMNRSEKMNGDKQITMLNSESSSIKEGTIYYDVRFNAVLPGKKEPITLIINLEIQTKDKPGYELVTRGIYYCARMISEQHGTVFTNEHYEDIQKVYSIWICPSTAKCRQNGMFRSYMAGETVFGNVFVEKEKYDLAEVIILNLGEADDESPNIILNLLNTLFSPTVMPDEKKKVLEQKYNIAMTAELESEVQYMCNLGTAIENQGIEKGIDIGELKKAEAIAMKLYKKGDSVESIADVTEVSVDQVKTWILSHGLKMRELETV